ncbi:dolichyl-diphosphooligosaccharide--protein glycosyltransferase, putative [Entamoeba dispar SAW760]|uniref:Dolichyl-diphosphooligosaccharide--protein glycosyltransferase 48 kDa subunit n=1 Tax=Entamoeba dispar (strain ATCC PRA-260 / SAW760) TaxID=370354 RepID=B0E6W0_ENTDS|nr:dolichyl-diphosphooligosaccharide--protein glycosyltransferase, putative [Entamoeba dispar SAW760]EDR29701.1 dolichyl-diphosphooligosaccharide--protein glycosyltransferase, putative [Entamoeba dispar SAW760]|eukprot:EDR29701.1 dolichyl-diphosphooligosaccharide--protein glycosyltransferase, putative [Entamoeba dispar SAW760]
MNFIVSLFFFIIFSFAHETKPILLVLQFQKQIDSFSQLISMLKNEGKLVETVDMDTPIVFESYGEFNYETVYILAPKYNFVHIKKQTLKSFIAKGGSVFMAYSPVYTKETKSFLELFKVKLSPSTNIIENNISTISNSLFPMTTIYYRGISFTLPDSNAFVPLLKSTSNDILSFTFQSLTNGRLAILGSIDMLNNNYFEKNKQFIQPLLQWSMNIHGKLQLKNIQIIKIDGVPDIENEGMFFTNDTVTVSFDIEQTMNGIVSGYIADDVQVEYRYVTPVILDFAQNLKNGSYSFTTVLPDQFGVYTIKINYTRPLLSSLHFEKVTPIRPWRHDHVARFQYQCYPFYLAFFGMLISTLIFVFFYLSYKELPKNIKTD